MSCDKSNLCLIRLNIYFCFLFFVKTYGQCIPKPTRMLWSFCKMGVGRLKFLFYSWLTLWQDTWKHLLHVYFIPEHWPRFERTYGQFFFVCVGGGGGGGCMVWILTSQSTAMVMSGQSVHLTTLFSWASLIKPYTSTSLVADKPSWISGREENGQRNYFMSNLNESMGPGRDQTCNLWICSKTHICSQTF